MDLAANLFHQVRRQQACTVPFKTSSDLKLLGLPQDRSVRKPSIGQGDLVLQRLGRGCLKIQEMMPLRTA
jgi:hypothetical protein